MIFEDLDDLAYLVRPVEQAALSGTVLVFAARMTRTVMTFLHPVETFQEPLRGRLHEGHHNRFRPRFQPGRISQNRLTGLTSHARVI